MDKVVGYNFGFKADIRKNEELIKILGGKKEIELDLSVVENGKITIGECKQNPKDFTDEIIRNVLEFGKYIDCDLIVFSSIGCLDILREKLTKMNLSGYPEWKILDEKNLSYMTAYLQSEIERRKRNNAQNKTEGNLEAISDRRDAFLEQYSMITNDRMNPSNVIGRYFHS